MAAETIHSGHFMVSHFEAEAQDDDESVATTTATQQQQHHHIETSLHKLFECMTLAYRQKLTSPRWNRFKGVRLRWKDKIRLNNVIWRCWHMQFIMKQNTLVCQFASPLDVDTHIKPETTILEGKYWKRRAAAVKAEYKKWRMYYRNKAFGCSFQDVSDVLSDMDVLDWQSQGDNTHMLVDEDYLSLMSDTLFSTITNNQPFAFPDTREIARGAVIADFIQPSLGPLQPNLEDFMDTLEPLQDLLNCAKLPPVPEESIATEDSVYGNTFQQQLIDSNFQQPLQQSSQFAMTSQMSTQHLPHLSQTSSMHHPSIHQSLPGRLQTISQTTNSQQTANMLSGQHDRSQSFNPGAQIDLTASVITQNQSQSIMMQPYGIITPNVIQHQSHVQQSVPGVAEPKAQHQYMQPPQKLYQQLPIASGYPSVIDRNYGMHQSHIDTSAYVSNASRRGNNGGCIRERVSRQRPSPLTQPLPAPYCQFNQSPTATNAPQTFKNEKSTSYGGSAGCHDMIINNTAIPQNINITAGIYLSNISGSGQSGEQAVSRFKMPSPPPQINSANKIALPKVSTSPSSSQHQIAAKGENFRSNSLPIGSSLSTVLGTQRVRRRPRSGSSSPGPARRPPLHATASEPTLNPASVLLAHLLTSKSQELYKPNILQSLSSDNLNVSQPVQTVAILPAPTVPIIVPKIDPTSPQLSSFNSGSSTGVPSPQSPSSPMDGGSGKEQKRAGHIHAEQKRRYNIKTGFDMLQTLIPQLSQNPSAKVSKAAMLQKGAQYIKQLQGEMNQIKEEMDTLKQQIECLNNSISNCQSLLPATGAPISRQRSGKLKEMFDEYVHQRTTENWKFWIFSLLMEPLLASFNNCVSPTSPEELKRSTLLWAEQHCSLMEMRPAVINSLRHLYTTTDILTNPGKLPDEARAAVGKKRSRDSRSNTNRL